jgi:type II secretory pathway component PulC
MSYRKVLRFLFLESSSRKRILLIIVFSLLMVIELQWMERQRAQIDQAIKEQAFVQQIPQMEQKLALLAEPPPPVPQEVQVVKQTIKLEGIIFGSGAASALINGKIYQQGDTVSGYAVSEIAERAVVLQNQQTQETLNIDLPAPNYAIDPATFFEQEKKDVPEVAPLP